MDSHVEKDEKIEESKKIRSASICATGFTSIEQMMSGVSNLDIEGNEWTKGREGVDSRSPSKTNTPMKKRRPATRTQSARISSSRNKSRKAAAQASNHHHEYCGKGMKSLHCNSEPRLTDNNADQGIRRRGSRRGQSMHQVHHRKSNAFLEVPEFNFQSTHQELDDFGEHYRLRSFSLTSKGIVNRGDSFKKKRSRSNSLVGDDASTEPAGVTVPKKFSSYTVAMFGARGVGKTALISQFMTSECINAYDRQRDDTPGEQSVFVMLNGEESELKFLNLTNVKIDLDKIPEPDAFIIMYSIIDKASFQRVEEYLTKLHDRDMFRTHPVIIVGNKIDLVRSRAVSIQDGKCMAYTYRAKFIEISVGINHNVDELLVGILNQIRLKCRYLEDKAMKSSNSDTHHGHWYKSRSVMRATMKARQMLTSLLGKEDSKLKNCENLHTL